MEKEIKKVNPKTKRTNLENAVNHRVASLLEETNTSNTDLAKYLGVTSACIGNYTHNVRGLKASVIVKIAEYFGVSTDYLLGISNSKVEIADKLNNLLNIPVVGKVSAGLPILADENIIERLPVAKDMFPNADIEKELFFLKVNGESMNNIFKNGSYVLIQKQNTADNGDIVVAIVNSDDEATLKRYKEVDQKFIILEPDSKDPEFEPIIISNKSRDFKILGKAIGYFQEL